MMSTKICFSKQHVVIVTIIFVLSLLVYLQNINKKISVSTRASSVQSTNLITQTPVITPNMVKVLQDLPYLKNKNPVIKQYSQYDYTIQNADAKLPTSTFMVSDSDNYLYAFNLNSNSFEPIPPYQVNGESNLYYAIAPFNYFNNTHFLQPGLIVVTKDLQASNLRDAKFIANFNTRKWSWNPNEKQDGLTPTITLPIQQEGTKKYQTTRSKVKQLTPVKENGLVTTTNDIIVTTYTLEDYPSELVAPVIQNGIAGYVLLRLTYNMREVDSGLQQITFSLDNKNILLPFAFKLIGSEQIEYYQLIDKRWQKVTIRDFASSFNQEIFPVLTNQSENIENGSFKIDSSVLDTSWDMVNSMKKVRPILTQSKNINGIRYQYGHILSNLAYVRAIKKNDYLSIEFLTLSKEENGKLTISIATIPDMSGVTHKEGR